MKSLFPLLVILDPCFFFAATFKLKKFNLQKDGFNLNCVGADVLYVRKGKDPHYEMLDTQLYSDIVDGRLKF